MTLLAVNWNQCPYLIFINISSSILRLEEKKDTDHGIYDTHVLDHAKFCGFSSNQVCVTKRPAFIQHTDLGVLEADSVDLHEVLRYPYLEAVPVCTPWPDQLCIVDWRLSVYFPPPVTRVSSPCAGPAPNPLLLLSCKVMEVIPRKFLV